MQVYRHPERFLPTPERVLARFRAFDSERAQTLIQRVLALPEDAVRAAAEAVLADFAPRHRQLGQTLREHCRLGTHALPAVVRESLSPWQEVLLGAYFTMEYAIESAAFFNPSIVPAPYQQGLPAGARRVFFSFRAVGEGHISSVVFREAIVHADGHLTHEPIGRRVDAPEAIDFPTHPHSELLSTCLRLDLPSAISQSLSQALPDPFTYAHLRQAVDEHRHHTSSADDHHRLHQLLEQLEDVYELRFFAGHGPQRARDFSGAGTRAQRH